MIPILINHDHEQLIGRATIHGRKLIVEFRHDARITKEMFFTIFNAGAQFIEVEHDGEVEVIRRAEIHEFSIRS